MLAPANELLSKAEIRDVTDCARFDDQCRKLNQLGLPFRAVGRSIKVSRHHLREWLSGRTVTSSREPDLSAVR